MMNGSVEKFQGFQITSKMYEDAARLFSNNYGIWGPLAEQHMGSFAKNGRRIRMSAARLKRQCLASSSTATNIYVRIQRGDKLVGNAFATQWTHEGRRFCWVTQLCVDVDYRRRGLATQLVAKLGEGEDDFGMGMLSSHPAAIQTLLRACGSSLETYEHGMAKKHARAMMRSCPAEYVCTAQLRGSVFDQVHSIDGAVSCADTGFYVDHGEPLAALGDLQARGVEWPFGHLPDGCEFLAVLVQCHQTTK